MNIFQVNISFKIQNKHNKYFRILKKQLLLRFNGEKKLSRSRQSSLLLWLLGEQTTYDWFWFTVTLKDEKIKPLQFLQSEDISSTKYICHSPCRRAKSLLKNYEEWIQHKSSKKQPRPYKYFKYIINYCNALLLVEEDSNLD